MTRLYRFALATVAATLALITLGSLARLHPAGTGCGNDWPRCNGSWLPALAWEPMVEYVHRGVALAVLVLAAATMATALRTPDAAGRIRLLASAGFGALVMQSLIGGATAVWGAPANFAILHLLIAMLFLGLAVMTLAAVAAQRGKPSWLATLGQWPALERDRAFAMTASIGAAVALLLLVFGASTSETGALACAAWPLCADGAAGAAGPIVHLGYRATALFGALATGTAVALSWRREASWCARRLAAGALLLVALQTALNALSTSIDSPGWMSSPQLLVATLLWVVMLSVALSAWGPRPEVDLVHLEHPRPDPGSSAGREARLELRTPAHSAALAMTAAAPSLDLGLPLPQHIRLRQTIADYVALTKPGIMTLLLTTTLCAMLMAARGLPPFWLICVTLLGGVLASGGANVLNCYIDRDIDGQMSRTRNRATAAGRVSPDAALAFGITLTVASVLLLGLLVNWTAALLALAGNLFYVLIYTRWLKRSTPYNIVVGGAAGAAPPLVGWAAVTGDLSPLAWGLFAIIFAWTPPHFWALALLKQGEYTRASVPMLPVVRGEAETRRQIVIYTALLMLVCLALTPLGLGVIYLAGAIVFNGIFLGYAVWLYRDPSKRVARQMFFYSIWYLALIFAAAVIDRIVLA